MTPPTAHGADRVPPQFEADLRRRERPGWWAWRVQHGLFAHDSGALHAEYRRLLEALLTDPDAPISAPPALDVAERRLVVERWNATTADTPRGPFHRLFEAQAARTPDDLALIFGDERLTFTELNARANRLARRLVALGVRPETIVALALERSVEMVISLLAVNKAGGAFLPIDPPIPPNADGGCWKIPPPLVVSSSRSSRDAEMTGRRRARRDRG